MGVVQITLSMSLDGFITGPDPGDKQPLGVETAIAQAKAAAGGKNVYIGGGASVADQALRLGLVDALNLHIEPVLLGGGTRLFAGLRPGAIRLERTRLIEGEPTTHLRFRVLR